MFENIKKLFRKTNKKEKTNTSSRDTAKERLHLVLMQDRANVSADFLDLMRQEIIEVIKKYIDIDESALDVRLTNQAKEDGTQGAPVLYANIPILNIKEDGKNAKKEENSNNKETIIQNDKIGNEKSIENTEDRNKSVTEENEEDVENAEEKKDDEFESEEEITKQEEEKIEEAIKIVEEENNNVNDSEDDQKEE